MDAPAARPSRARARWLCLLAVVLGGVLSLSICLDYERMDPTGSILVPVLATLCLTTLMCLGSILVVCLPVSTPSFLLGLAIDVATSAVSWWPVVPKICERLGSGSAPVFEQWTLAASGLLRILVFALAWRALRERRRASQSRDGSSPGRVGPSGSSIDFS